MKIIKVSSGNNHYVGNFTSEENAIIKSHLNGKVLHLFSGKSDIGDVRVDFSFGNVKKDVFDYIKENKPEINTILLDPIYLENVKYEGMNLYKFPYDTRKTKLLWDYFKELYPRRIILKCLGYYTIPNYMLLQGYSIYVGAFKPNRCIGIYQAKNKRLGEFHDVSKI